MGDIQRCSRCDNLGDRIEDGELLCVKCAGGPSIKDRFGLLKSFQQRDIMEWYRAMQKRFKRDFSEDRGTTHEGSAVHLQEHQKDHGPTGEPEG